MSSGFGHPPVEVLPMCNNGFGRIDVFSSHYYANNSPPGFGTKKFAGPPPTKGTGRRNKNQVQGAINHSDTILTQFSGLTLNDKKQKSGRNSSDSSQSAGTEFSKKQFAESPQNANRNSNRGRGFNSSRGGGTQPVVTDANSIPIQKGGQQQSGQRGRGGAKNKSRGNFTRQSNATGSNSLPVEGVDLSERSNRGRATFAKRGDRSSGTNLTATPPENKGYAGRNANKGQGQYGVNSSRQKKITRTFTETIAKSTQPSGVLSGFGAVRRTSSPLAHSNFGSRK